MTVDSLSVALLLLGLMSWLLMPVLERLQGEVGGDSAFSVGVASLVLALITGWGSDAGLVAISSVLLMAWAVVVYVGFRAAANSESQPPDAPASANCDPVLRLGVYTRSETKEQTWRSYLYPLFVCRPTHSGMTQLAWAAGGVYYGLYFTTARLEISPAIRVSCQRSDDLCRAHAVEQGQVACYRAPVRICVSNVLSLNDDTVTVVTQMGAALNASAGPSITASAGGLGGSLSFPDASLAVTVAMGSYQWGCERG